MQTETDKSRQSGVVTFLESLVIVMILLVIVETFLEEFAVLARTSAQTRKVLTMAGFFFDLFFTVEFLVRFYFAAASGRSYLYLTKERGWIDFLASVPLLIFSSGPVMISYFVSGSAILGVGGLLNLLKVIKAIRIARVLRFLRIIKLFRTIKYVDSVMAQRHVATITSISVTVLVGFLLLFSVISTVVEIPGLGASFLSHQEVVDKTLTSASRDSRTLRQTLAALPRTEETLLLVKLDGKTLFSRYDNDYYLRNFAAGDYSYITHPTPAGVLEYYLDMRPYATQMALENVSYLMIVILLVLAFLVIYSPHFALTVTDPIHVMNRGLTERDYNLAVKIPEKYADDDIYVLARNYNDIYLPLKDVSGGGGAEAESLLSMEADDIRDMLAETEIKP